MTIGHIVTGYDKRTQRLTIEHVIPESVFDEVRALADVPETDAEAIGSYSAQSRRRVRDLFQAVAAHERRRLRLVLGAGGNQGVLQKRTELTLSPHACRGAERRSPVCGPTRAKLRHCPACRT